MTVKKIIICESMGDGLRYVKSVGEVPEWCKIIAPSTELEELRGLNVAGLERVVLGDPRLRWTVARYLFIEGQK